MIFSSITFYTLILIILCLDDTCFKKVKASQDNSNSLNMNDTNDKYTEYIMIHKPTVKKKINQILRKITILIKDTFIQLGSFTFYILNELREIDLLA